MSGLRRVIVGASGSPGSLRALRHAEDLARQSDATLIPVLAWVPPGGDLAARQPCPAMVRIWHEAAWQRLWDALEAAWGMVPVDLSVQPAVQRGQPGPVLAGAWPGPATCSSWARAAAAAWPGLATAGWAATAWPMRNARCWPCRPPPSPRRAAACTAGRCGAG